MSVYLNYVRVWGFSSSLSQVMYREEGKGHTSQAYQLAGKFVLITRPARKFVVGHPNNVAQVWRCHGAAEDTLCMPTIPRHSAAHPQPPIHQVANVHHLLRRKDLLFFTLHCDSAFHTYTSYA